MMKKAAAIGRILTACLVVCLALCGLIHASAKADTEAEVLDSPQYRVWVAVTVMSGGAYNSCENSGGYLVMPTVRQDGSPGTTWYARINPNEWDTKSKTFVYGFGSGLLDVEVDRSTLFRGQWPAALFGTGLINGYPTQLLVVEDLSETSTQYIKNNNSTWYSKLAFDVFFTGSSQTSTWGGLPCIGSWEEVTGPGKYWSDPKIISADARPKATRLDITSFNRNPIGDLVIPRFDHEEPYTYKLHVECRDQYGARWYKDNAESAVSKYIFSTTYAPLTEYDNRGISVDKEGVITITNQAALDFIPDKNNKATSHLYLFVPTAGSQTLGAMGSFVLYQAQYAMYYHDENGKVLKTVWTPFSKTAWEHPAGWKSPPAKAPDDTYHYSGTWTCNHSTSQIWQDAHFYPQYTRTIHTWDSGKAAQGTADDPGCPTVYTCTVCGHKKTEYSAGHSWQNVNREDSTCTADGYSDDKCAVCGAEKHTVLKATGHKVDSSSPYEAPSCAEAGCEALWHCQNCRQYFLDPDCTNQVAQNDAVIPAIGHQWGELEYSWSNDFSVMTVSHRCLRDSSHTEVVSTGPGMYCINEGTAEGIPVWQAVTAETASLSGGWWAVTADTVISDCVTLTGEVHLILCDGAALTLAGGVDLNAHTLHIHLQSAATGTLTATAANAFSGNSIVLPDGVAVIAGPDQASAEPSDYSLRADNCRLSYARIESCELPHNYTEQDNEWHTRVCTWCGSVKPADALDTLEGNGTARNPYIISSAEDWNAFASYVNSGGGTRGMYFYQALHTTIPVSVTVGTEASPFSGIFAGQNTYGGVLDLSLDSTDSFCAPFRYIRGATLRNVKVTGSVRGGIHCAGLVGTASGSNTLQDCEVSAEVITSGTHCGGVIGHGGTSSASLRNILFNGSISGASHAGTLWGWSDSGSSVSLTGCLDLSTCAYPIGLGDGSVSVSRTYYTNADKPADSSRLWDEAKRGQLAWPIDGSYFRPVLTGNAGIQVDHLFYAAAGDEITFTAEDNDHQIQDRIILVDSSLTSVGPDSTVLRLRADDSGAFSFTMPAMGLFMCPAHTISFVNADGTPLQEILCLYFETPEYTGETPVMASDDRHVRTFRGWTPAISEVSGSATYTAVYDVTPVLLEGENVLSLEEGTTVACLFTPVQDGDYRLRSEGSHQLSLYCSIWDGDTRLAADERDNFDYCAAGLEAGKTYTVRVRSSWNSGNLTLRVDPVVLHSIQMDPAMAHGRVETEINNMAYEGQDVWLIVTADEGYALTELTVTDTNGNPLDVEYEGFTMGASDVTVSAVFETGYEIHFNEQDYMYFGGSIVNGHGSAAEGAKAAAGQDVHLFFAMGQEYDPDKISITATADGSDVPYGIINSQWFGEECREVCFIMPASDVSISASIRPAAQPFEAADFNLPDGAKWIAREAFQGNAMNAVYIPDCCDSIDDYAFRNCADLTRIRIPENCLLGRDVFDGCTAVTVYGAAGSPAEIYCNTHDNCTFLVEAP